MDNNASNARVASLLRLAMVLASGALGYIVAVGLRSMLPDRFSYDAMTIQLTAKGLQPFGVDKSFRAAANVYRALGLSNDAWLAGILGYTVAYLALIFASVSGHK